MADFAWLIFALGIVEFTLLPDELLFDLFMRQVPVTAGLDHIKILFFIIKLTQFSLNTQ